MEQKSAQEQTTTKRHRHNHELRIHRIGWMIDRGYPVYVITQARNMPKADTIWRLIAADCDLRDRYEKASHLRRARIADETVMLTDRLSDDSRSGRRLRIAIRKWRADVERDGPVGRSTRSTSPQV
jgi:hypothetical protein